MNKTIFRGLLRRIRQELKEPHGQNINTCADCHYGVCSLSFTAANVAFEKNHDKYHQSLYHGELTNYCRELETKVLGRSSR